MGNLFIAQAAGLPFVGRFRHGCKELSLVVAILVAAMVAATPAQAAPQVTGEGVCMDDLFPGNLKCTANDVAISGVATDPATGDYLLTIRDDGCQYPGDTVDFDAIFEVVINATERFDIGTFFAIDGDFGEVLPDGALSGTCTVATLPTDDPDGDGPLFGLDLDEAIGQTGDSCGDINKSNNPMFIPVSLTDVVCADPDGDEQLNLPNCVSWRQKGANEVCTMSDDAYPGAPSKCRCDEAFNVPITVPPAKLELTKTATVSSIDEGKPKSVTFNIKVKNPGLDPDNYVLLSTLTDDMFGDLTDTTNTSLNSTTCNTLVGDRLDADGTDEYTCAFTATIVGNPSEGSHKNVATVSGTDMRSNTLGDDDDETITFNDLTPVIEVTKTASPTILDEPGGNVTFTVKVKSNSNMSDPVSLTSLSDSVFGNLNGQGDCATGASLASGETYSCSFTAEITGAPGYKHNNIVTAKAVDDEGNETSDVDDATVEIRNVAGAGFTVTKTASPDSVDEPGGQVTFSVSVKNNSTVDWVTIDSMVDDVHGDITAVGGDISATTCTIAASNCSVGRVLAPLASCGCSFTALVDLDYADEPKYEKDTVTIDGTDDDGDPVTGFDSAIVNVNNVQPSATVSKTAKSATVTYEVVVVNKSTAEALTLNSLMDDKFGDLTDGSNLAISNSTCSPSQSIPVGGSYKCQFDAVVNAADSPHTNTVTAEVGDNDGSVAVKPTDSATVELK
ncbi:MAG: hypothetical protein AMJ59_24245 [Gammaproteobacteria bacterium SG8_31]|jgi:hypothetical protein|nr:MAG: hypothetical protein AMJ59_24245 [Gammaproteobacteria bacterium SG8_31]